MIIKLIGGLLVFVACGALGIAASNKYSQRPKEIRKLRASIQMLETEIIFGCTPLPLALSNISCKADGAISRFFANAAEDLLAGISHNLESAWFKAVDQLLSESNIDMQDGELIKDFGKVLGGSDREDQKKHFELLYIQLRQHEEMAEDARKKNEKMYKSLGFLSGLVIFIILV